MSTLAEFTCGVCGQFVSVAISSSSSTIECPRCRSALNGLRLRTVEGFIYVLSNPSIPGLVKIGRTSKSVEERRRELSSATGVPEEYVIEAYFCSDDSTADEGAVHETLAATRKPGREFFALSTAEAINRITALLKRQPHFCRGGPFKSRGGLAPTSTEKKIWERCFRCGSENPYDQEGPNVCSTCGGTTCVWPVLI